jgi:hypothetical protein
MKLLSHNSIGVRSSVSLRIAAPIRFAKDPAPLSELDALLRDYRGWLIGDRGLAEATVLRYQTCARRFLELRTGRDGAVDVESLTGVDVTAFLLSEAQRCSVGATKERVAELRALLRYLYLRGSTTTLLSGSERGGLALLRTTDCRCGAQAQPLLARRV